MQIEDYSVASSQELPASPRTPRKAQIQTRPFLKGPVPLDWLKRATLLRKPAMPAGLALWFQRGLSRNVGPIRIVANLRKKFGLSAAQMLRGLRSLEADGLVRFVKDGRGRCAVVEIIDPPADVGR